MRSKDVLKILKITRPTLTSYVKNGKIRAVLQPNNFYDYNEDDVLLLHHYFEDKYEGLLYNQSFSS